MLPVLAIDLTNQTDLVEHNTFVIIDITVQCITFRLTNISQLRMPSFPEVFVSLRSYCSHVTISMFSKHSQAESERGLFDVFFANA